MASNFLFGLVAFFDVNEILVLLAQTSVALPLCPIILGWWGYISSAKHCIYQTDFGDFFGRFVAEKMLCCVRPCDIFSSNTLIFQDFSEMQEPCGAALIILCLTRRFGSDQHGQTLRAADRHHEPSCPLHI